MKQKVSRKKHNSRSKSSGRWLQEHFDDPYVKKAQQEGYRSRASYKLLELQEKDGLIRKGMVVVDLGAAPGGWSQVAASLVGDEGHVIASDILVMDAVANVEFILGDFTEDGVFEQLLSSLGDSKADIVLSDMAPNMSGTGAVDQARSMNLVELAVDMAQKVLVQGGAFVCKVFQGEGFDQLVKDLRQQFDTVKIRKPAASRPRSREVYIVARDFRG